MKKQLNPTIKAHLIRSAFYLLLLLGVCAIPFALAQRNAPRRSMAKPDVAAGVPQLATTSSLPTFNGMALPAPQHATGRPPRSSRWRAITLSIWLP